MFTGIVEATGEVLRAERREGGVRLALRVPETLRDLAAGSSLCVSGVCLTVVESEGDGLAFDAVGATLRRTLLGTLRPGDRVNLERSLCMGASLDGHLVTGHVDGVGTIVSKRDGEGALYFDIETPSELSPQIARRGSVAVDGVSLTVAETSGNAFTVSIVPFTLRATTLGDYRPGRRVHVETDVLAKYVERALGLRGERRPLEEWLARSEKTP
jgi:riboflavin synthase